MIKVGDTILYLKIVIDVFHPTLFVFLGRRHLQGTLRREAFRSLAARRRRHLKKSTSKCRQCRHHTA